MKKSPSRLRSNQRVQAAIDAINRISLLPHSFFIKTQLVCSVGISKIIRGSAFTLPSTSTTNKLRTLICKTLFGAKRCMRCSEVVFGVIFPLHKVEPVTAIVTRYLSDLRRLGNRSPSFRKKSLKLMSPFRIILPLRILKKSSKRAPYSFCIHCMSMVLLSRTTTLMAISFFRVMVSPLFPFTILLFLTFPG